LKSAGSANAILPTAVEIWDWVQDFGINLFFWNETLRLCSGQAFCGMEENGVYSHSTLSI